MWCTCVYIHVYVSGQYQGILHPTPLPTLYDMLLNIYIFICVGTKCPRVTTNAPPPPVLNLPVIITSTAFTGISHGVLQLQLHMCLFVCCYID